MVGPAEDVMNRLLVPWSSNGCLPSDEGGRNEVGRSAGLEDVSTRFFFLDVDFLVVGGGGGGNSEFGDCRKVGKEAEEEDWLLPNRELEGRCSDNVEVPAPESMRLNEPRTGAESGIPVS